MLQSIARAEEGKNVPHDRIPYKEEKEGKSPILQQSHTDYNFKKRRIYLKCILNILASSA